MIDCHLLFYLTLYKVEKELYNQISDIVISHLRLILFFITEVKLFYGINCDI